MKTFCVRVEEMSTLHLDIEAKSREEAYNKVEKMLGRGEILFDEVRPEYDVDVSDPEEYDTNHTQ